MQPNTTWPGTLEEFTAWKEVMIRLMAQSDPACGCVPVNAVMPGVTCLTHREATENQRWLNGLVMMRRRRFRLMHEEGLEP